MEPLDKNSHVVCHAFIQGIEAKAIVLSFSELSLKLEERRGLVTFQASRLGIVWENIGKDATRRLGR